MPNLVSLWIWLKHQSKLNCTKVGHDTWYGLELSWSSTQNHESITIEKIKYPICFDVPVLDQHFQFNTIASPSSVNSLLQIVSVYYHILTSIWVTLMLNVVSLIDQIYIHFWRLRLTKLCHCDPPSAHGKDTVRRPKALQDELDRGDVRRTEGLMMTKANTVFYSI